MRIILTSVIIVLLSISVTANTDSMLTLLDAATDEEKVEILKDLYIETRFSNSAECEEYVKNGIEMSHKIADIENEIIFICFLGDIFRERADFQIALDWYNEAYELSENKNNFAEEAVVTERLGMVYGDLYDLEKSQEYFLRTLKLREDSTDFQDIFNITMNLGILYQQMSKLDSAFDYYQRAQSLIPKIEDKDSIGSLYLNLGIVYQEKKELETALEYFQRALIIFEELDITIAVVQALNNIGTVYAEKEDHSKELEICKKAHKLAEGIDDKHVRETVSINLAMAFYNSNNFQRAEDIFLETLDDAVKHNHIDIRTDLYYFLALVYAELGDSRKTFDFYNKYSVLADSLYNEESKQRIDALQVKFDLESKEEEILNLKNEKKIQYLVRNFLIVISALIFIVLLILIQYFRIKNRAVQLLIESKNKFQDMFEKHSAVMLLLNPKTGRIIRSNAAAKEFYGFTNGNETGQNVYSISTKSDEEIAGILQKMLNQKQNRFISSIKLDNGQIRDVDFFATPIMVDEQKVIYAIIQDITDRLHFERELTKLNNNLLERINDEVAKVSKQQEIINRKSKLESLGKLAAGIAHEINQPVGGISLIADNILIKHQRKELTEEYLKSKHHLLSESVNKIRNIINQVRTFSRVQQFVSLEKIDLNNVINNSLMIITPQFNKHNINLSLGLEENLGFILGDKYKTEQVILNLLTNAEDAVDQRAQFSKESYQKEVGISTFKENGNVILEVKDNGIGISEENLTKIFDPFFTTKDPEKGTGLGLSIVFGISEEMKGTISVDSKENEYTIFRLMLKKY